MAEKARIVSVDVLRGLTMALMVLVNNPGSEPVFTQLDHSAWNGFTLCDWVFPSFVFVMGVSMFISMRSRGFALSWKALRRAVLLFAIGLALNLAWQLAIGLGFDWTEIRIPGVLQRLALCFGFGALIVSAVPEKRIWIVIAGLLAGYGAALLLGNGYSQGADSILSRIDSSVLGDKHLYRNHAPDPEGLLSTFPAVAHVLLGFLAGGMLVRGDTGKMAFAGVALLAAGLLLSPALPLNKNVWSPSFVLLTSGISMLALAGLHYLIDTRKALKYNGFWLVFGTNAIWCYMLSALLAIAMYLTGWGQKLMDLIGRNPWTSLAYALCFVLAIWAVTLPLYKNHKFIKL